MPSADIGSRMRNPSGSSGAYPMASGSGIFSANVTSEFRPTSELKHEYSGYVYIQYQSDFGLDRPIQLVYYCTHKQYKHFGDA